MYLSSQPLWNMPLDLTGLQPLGKEVKVCPFTLMDFLWGQAPHI